MSDESRPAESASEPLAAESNAPLVVGAGLLVAAIAVVYLPVLRNGFVWDDWENIVGSRGWRSLDLAGVVAAFRSRVGGHFQPLTWISWAVDDRVWNGDPRGYHLGNLLLHLLNTLVVMMLAARLLQAAGREARVSRIGAVLAAALFALHPMRVESVAWATERRDVLSAFFALLSLLAWVEGGMAERDGDAPKRAGRWRVASLVLFAVGLLAKSIAPLPAVLLVLDVFPLGRHRDAEEGPSFPILGRLLVEKLPFLLLSALSAIAAVRAQASTGALVALGEQGIAARLAQAAYGLGFYVATFFSPVRSPLVERPTPLDPFEPRFVLALAAVAVVGVFLVARCRRFPALAAAAAAYVLLLLPVLGLFQSGVQLVADRYSYLPNIGWGILAGGAIAELALRRGAAVRGALAAAVVLLLASGGAASRRQVAVWHDDETLSHSVLVSGPSALAENNLGAMALGAGRVHEAVDRSLRSLEIAPAYSRPWSTLRRILESQPGEITPGEAARIVETLGRSLRHQEGSATAHYIHALALERSGDRPGARRALLRALEIRPDHAESKRALERIGSGERPPG